MKKYPELLNSFFFQLRERLTSPLLGSLIIFWLVFNWEPVSIYLFSSKPIEEIITHIHVYYSDISSNLILPIISACIYILLYPSLSWLTFYFWESFERKKSNARAALYSNESLSIDQSLSLKERYAKKHAQIAELIKSH
jgi:hypothetical protein